MKSISLSRNKFIKEFRKQIWGYIFIAPALFFFILFVLVPFTNSINISFYNYSISNQTFIGFDNYTKMFNDPIFAKSVINTLKYVAIVVPTVLIFSFLIANAVYEKSQKTSSFVRAAFYLPAIVPAVCFSIIWKWMYNPQYGLFNTIGNSMGLPTIDFLGDERFALVSTAIVVITWSVGQPIILYIAALNGVPQTYKEAAEIDGANRFQKMVHVMIPLIKPTTLYIMIITTINVMQVIEVIILMTGGGPYYATNSLLFMVYQQAFKIGNFGYAAAIGNFMFIVIAILSVIQFKWLSSDVQY